MTNAPLPANVEAAIRRALKESWSGHTQSPFDPENPSYNQCSQTAIVVFEKFHGEILKTRVRTLDGHEYLHFYNRIGGQRYDFTAQQFEHLEYCEELEYQDIPSNVSEAAAGLQGTQLSSMRSAFANFIQRHMPSTVNRSRVDLLKP